jgi:hypothetical protein
MTNQSPTGNERDRHLEDRRDKNVEDKGFQPDERPDDQSPHKGHGPLKGTDTPATTNAEDLDKAHRTTM